MTQFVFKSDLDASFHEDLNSLLFFNFEQRKVAEGIIASIEKYGLPKIIEINGKLKVSLEKVPEIQAIFAIDSHSGVDDLVGVMLFFREAVDCLSLIHIAVKESYTFQSSRGSSLLAVELLYKLKDIAKQLKNVDYLTIYYQKYVAKRIMVQR